MIEKKVLIISTVGLIYDGITSVIQSYLKAMDLSGLKIYVSGTIQVEAKIKKQIEGLGCVVIDLPNRRKETLAYVLALTDFIKKNRIDVVHAHGNSGTLAIEMCAAWIGGCKKRIVHSHNTKCDQIRADRILRPLMNLLYTDALACGNDAGKWLFKDRAFYVLKNGRDIGEFSFDQTKRDTIRKQHGIGNEIVIGHVGGFFEQKNHSFLVKIYRAIKEIDPNVKFFMIGDGPLRKEIEEESSDLNVIFTGAIDCVSDYLNAMDVMVLPSLFEGVPLVVLEWQINGLPSILADTISRECAVTNSVKFMSLNTHPKEWAEKILENRKNDRLPNAQTAIQKITSTGFDIKDSAKFLRQLYMMR